MRSLGNTSGRFVWSFEWGAQPGPPRPALSAEASTPRAMCSPAHFPYPTLVHSLGAPIEA